MKMVKKLIGIVLTLPVMAACAAYDMDSVGSMEVNASPFAKSLHGQYMRVANDEAAEGDWADAIFFRNKAQMAAEAANEEAALPEPQMVGDRDIPGDAQGDLNAAYDSLVAALEDGRSKKPVTAAIAQASYDCWLQEQEENIQPEHIALCRDDFEDALASLTEIPEPVVETPAPSGEVVMVAGPFMVYFDYNSAELDLATQAYIMNLAAHKYATDEMGYAVLTGHADLSGDTGYNEALAEKRVMAVVAALEAGGATARILSSSYGESRPMKETDDGVREARNRRVEITLSR